MSAFDDMLAAYRYSDGMNGDVGEAGASPGAEGLDAGMSAWRAGLA